MARLTSEIESYLPRTGGLGRLTRRFRPEPPSQTRNLLIAGVVLLGVGYLALHVLGPDVKRYMKMRDM